MPADPITLAVIGASGVTGGHVLAEAERLGLSPFVIGRDSARLRQRVADAGIRADRVRLADAQDNVGLRKALSGISHVISTVAPFSANGFEIARAAAELGLGYTDSAGETGFMMRVSEALDAEARASGATLCTGNGVAAFLGDVATRWIAPLGDETGSATILYDITGYRPSAGSFQSYLAHILPEGGAALRNGQVVRFPLGAFSGAVGKHAGVHGIFPDALVISRYWRAKRIDTLMKASSCMRPFIRTGSAIMTISPLNAAFAALPWRRWLAAGEADDVASRCTVYVETVDGSGHSARRAVRIDRIYRGTAQVMLATIMAMNRRKQRPTGIRAASDMFKDFGEVLDLSGVQEIHSPNG